MSLNDKPRPLPARPSLNGLEADIALTRARFGQHLGELRHKATPFGLIQEAQALFLDAGSPVRASTEAYVRQVSRRGSQGRPTHLGTRGAVILALAGAATAWLLVRAYKSGNRAQCFCGHLFLGGTPDVSRSYLRHPR